MDEFRQESSRSGFEQKSTAAISHEDASPMRLGLGCWNIGVTGEYTGK